MSGSLTCPKNIGGVGRDFFFLLMMSEGGYNDVISMYSLCDYLCLPCVQH